jgi:hypothetical protein
LPFAWAVLWVGAAVFQALPQNRGTGPAGVLVAAEYLIGLGVLASRTRMPAAALGLALGLVFWVVGQHFGGLSSGQATDSNSGPLVALMAIALIGVPSPTQVAARREPRH